MSFVLLDDKFHSHPKRTEVGLSGAGLFACALSYCGDHLTDGFVPGGWAHEIASRPLCKRLVVAGFWIEVAPGDGPYLYVSGDESYGVEIVKAGYFIPDYLVLNPNREAVLSKRSELSAKRSEAGKKGAAKRWQRDSKGGGKALASAWQTDGPLSPSPKEITKAVDLPRHDGERPHLHIQNPEAA